MIVITFVGPTGSGTSSYAREIVKQTDEFAHISSGDIARTIESDEADAALAEGELHPAEEIIRNTVLRMMEENSNKMIILDGFPRTAEQVQFLKDNDIEIDVCVDFQCQREILLKRCLARGRDIYDMTTDSVNKRIVADTARCVETIAAIREEYPTATTFTGTGTIYLTIQDTLPYCKFIHSTKQELSAGGIQPIATMIRQEMTAQLKKFRHRRT